MVDVTKQVADAAQTLMDCSFRKLSNVVATLAVMKTDDSVDQEGEWAEQRAELEQKAHKLFRSSREAHTLSEACNYIIRCEEFFGENDRLIDDLDCYNKTMFQKKD